MIGSQGLITLAEGIAAWFKTGPDDVVVLAVRQSLPNSSATGDTGRRWSPIDCAAVGRAAGGDPAPRRYLLW
jgi:hypothetical protein